jgi:hypothetical protein
LLDADADRACLELRLIKLLLKDRARVHPFADNDCLWRIVLQKSKIEQLQKSRERRFLDVPAAAKSYGADTKVRGRFLCETMWSLISPRAKRISGPEKLWSSP